MQPRLLFVAGMTIGVMTPLVWAAYVARPAAHTALAPTVDVARAAPATHKPTPKPTPMPAAKIVTGSIGPAPAATSAPKTTVRVTLPPPKPTTKPRTATHVIAHAAAAASARAAPMRRTADARPHHVRRHVSERYAPAIVDHYNGAHIITVCAALTENEQLRAGCP